MAKKKPTPEQIAEIRAALVEVRRELREVIDFLQAKLDARKA